MARTNNLTNFLTDVATAIKTKKGDNTPIPASNFDTEIENLPSGGDENAIIDVASFKAGGEYIINFLAKVPTIDVSTLRYKTNLSYMFSGVKKAKEISVLNTNDVVNMAYMFEGCSSLETLPTMNTTNVKNFSCFCQSCLKLQNVNVLNMSSATNVYNMFYSCRALTDTSLDNILQSLISATSYTGTKTLAQVGFDRYSVPSSKWSTLTHYQDFIDEGWSIGYSG